MSLSLSLSLCAFFGPFTYITSCSTRVHTGTGTGRLEKRRFRNQAFLMMRGPPRAIATPTPRLMRIQVSAHAHGTLVCPPEIVVAVHRYPCTHCTLLSYPNRQEATPTLLLLITLQAPLPLLSASLAIRPPYQEAMADRTAEFRTLVASLPKPSPGMQVVGNGKEGRDGKRERRVTRMMDTKQGRAKDRGLLGL